MGTTLSLIFRRLASKFSNIVHKKTSARSGGTIYSATDGPGGPILRGDHPRRDISINFHRDSCGVKSGSGLGTISDGKLGGGWERGGGRCMCVCVCVCVGGGLQLEGKESTS